jgi:signal transduction histidine kinase
MKASELGMIDRELNKYDPAMQKDIFRLFYRGSEAENSHAGLALSRRIIEVHGGRMWIESVVNKGCIVYFTIP